MAMKDIPSILICLSLVFFSQTYGFIPGVNDTNNADVCPYTDVNDREITESPSWRVFNQLTANETLQVYDFMFKEMGYYNPEEEVPPPTTSGPNFIYRVELMEPVKDEVLNYLDGEGPEPERFAIVIAIRPLSKPKDVMEYKIGPIPITPGAKKDPSKIGLKGDDSPREGVIAQKLRADGEIPFSKRPAEMVAAGWTETVVNREAYKLKKMFKDTCGWCYGVNISTIESLEESLDECGTSLVSWLSFPAIDLDSTKRIMHIVWFFNPRNGGGDERNLHPIPISFKLDEEDTEEENWNTFDYEYCHQGPFSSAEELLEAYENGTLVKCVAEDWKDYNYDEGWSRTDNRDTPRPGSEKAAPRTFYPEGPRFSAEQAEPGTGFWFSYMGWEGHVSMRCASGIIFHDLRFREHRIAYELSLQEQFVAYGGFSGAGQTVFMDSYYGIGLTSQSLRRGRDCPEVARYFPASKFHVSGHHDMTEDAICIFEEDSQTPEWRHTHANGTENKPHADAVRRSTLVIRTVATVGNYDYLYSIRFKPDASISVETTLAGYMLTSFFDVDGQTDRDIAFGTRVGKHTLALLHDHLSGWKVDLDVLGTENSVRRMSVKIGTWEEALRDAAQGSATPPPWHRSPVVKYIHTETLENEFGFQNHDPGTVVHSFINEQETNAWGYPRGYSIVHGMTTRQLLPDTHPFTKAASWTKYHLAVTQRKERELMSHGAVYDMHSPGDPVTSFDRYLDDESIRKTDLVAWVMMGLLHIPRSEDVPLISNFASQFYIKPWNYYNGLASMDLGNKEDFSSCRPSVGRSFDYSWGY